MKTNIKSIFFLFGAAFLFTACVNEEDDLFDKSAAERLNEVSATYSERFVAPTSGWSMEYYPNPETVSPTDDWAPNTRGYLLSAKFSADGTVDMATNISASDFGDYLVNKAHLTQYGGTVTDKSTWNVNTDMGPVLSFNSYSQVMHIFSNPGIYDLGNGLEGDYEFAVIDLPEEGDIAMLKGKKRDVYVRMTKIDEGVELSDYINDVNNFSTTIFSPSAPNNIVMKLGETKYQIESASTGIMNIYPYDGDNVTDEDFYPFLVSKRGGKYYLRFRDALRKVEGEQGPQEFVFNEETGKFVDVDNEQNVIQGEDAAPFFFNKINGGSSWSWVRTTTNSDAMNTLNSRIYEEMRKVGYTCNARINFMLNKAGDFVCAIPFTFKNGRQTVSATATFKFNVSDQTTEGVTLTYAGAGETAGETLYGQIAAVKEFINYLSTTLTIDAAETSFNLATLKLAPATDTSKWFVVTLFN